MSTWFHTNRVAPRPELYNKLESHFADQKQQIRNVRCLLNLNVDFFYPGCLRGLSVELYGGYVLSEADALWLHPAMNRCCTIFTTGCDAEEITSKLPELKRLIHGNSWCVEDDPSHGGGDQSVGLYVYRTTDEYAVTREDFRVIIEHVPNITRPPLKGKLSDWMQHYELACRDLDTLESVTTMARSIFPHADMVSHKQTNAFFKRESSYVYLNYAWKLNANEDHAYVKMHPSLGFCRYAVEPHTIPIICPATIGYEDHVTTWSEMNPRRLEHINRALSWTNEALPFHRHIQRTTVAKNAAADAYIASIGLTRGEYLYAKCVICGSCEAPYAPEDVLALTSEETVPFGVVDLIEHIRKNHADVKDLFNPKYISADGTTLMLAPDILRTLCS